MGWQRIRKAPDLRFFAFNPAGCGQFGHAQKKAARNGAAFLSRNALD